MISNAGSTPTLCLYSLPTKPPDPPGLLTPPLHTLVSIPFQWEEAPGKPRTTAEAGPPASKLKAARSLDLPPRLITESAKTPSPGNPQLKTARSLDLPPRLTSSEGGKITNMPSPTTVLDGPTPGRFLSNTVSFRSPRGSFRSPGEIKRGERVRFSSWRWGGDSKGSSDFSSDYVGDTKVKKITRVRRKGSFLRFSDNTNSSLLGTIYESFKKVVPWKRRQVKSRNMSF
ncbi:hypothetical protein LguiA_031792 [Lonicera macranthoides]